MIFVETRIPGAYAIEPVRNRDHRGYFTRTHCGAEFGERGLAQNFRQTSASFNRARGTLRGLHFQQAPAEETKLVRCVRGAAFDVIVDLRINSAMFGKWIAVEISADNGRSVYVPEGCAHGFQTLEDDTELLYQISCDYQPALAAGIRWDDPDIGIKWPCASPILSERDLAQPTLDELFPAADTVAATGTGG